MNKWILKLYMLPVSVYVAIINITIIIIHNHYHDYHDLSLLCPSTIIFIIMN